MNDKEIKEYFKKENYFDIPSENILFFSQVLKKINI